MTRNEPLDLDALEREARGADWSGFNPEIALILIQRLREAEADTGPDWWKARAADKARIAQLESVREEAADLLATLQERTAGLSAKSCAIWAERLRGTLQVLNEVSQTTFGTPRVPASDANHD